MFEVPKKALVKLGAFCYLLLLVWATNRVWQDHKTAVARQLTEAKALNDSTQAVLASTQFERDTLRVLYQAAKQLNGELVAAVRIHVRRRDTLFIHDSIVTTVYKDGTRTASFRDSTAWAMVQGTVTAPPFPGALGVEYKLTRPAFSPAVGFVKSGDAYLAVVSWQGEKFEIKAPYVDPPVIEPRLSPYVRAAWSPLGAGMAGAGMQGRIGKYRPFVELQSIATPQDFTHHIWLGATRRF